MFVRFIQVALLGAIMACGVVMPGQVQAAPYAAMVMDARNGEVRIREMPTPACIPPP